MRISADDGNGSQDLLGRCLLSLPSQDEDDSGSSNEKLPRLYSVLVIVAVPCVLEDVQK